VNAKRDRDHLLEEALTHELRATGAPAADACLDVETMAAWMDGGLDSNAMAMAEAHASTCERCQAQLATVARTVPVAAIARPQTRGVWRWWLAPLAASAAAATLWMVVPQEPYVAPPSPAVSAPAAESAAPILEAARPEAQPSAPAVAVREQKTEAPELVTARATPSANVIWRVGRAGLVQLATDGRTFTRLPFPEAVDLTAVTATDESHAVVTAADGRTFQTADGGRTWQRP